MKRTGNGAAGSTLIRVKDKPKDFRACAELKLADNGLFNWPPERWQPNWIGNEPELKSLIKYVVANFHVVEGFDRAFQGADGKSYTGNRMSPTVKTCTGAKVWFHEWGHGLGLGENTISSDYLMWQKGGSGLMLTESEASGFEEQLQP